MKIRVFDSRNNNLLGTLTRIAMKKGVDLKRLPNCLCEHEQLDADIVLSHPHDNYKRCWKRIKTIVQENPETESYIIVYGRLERREGIGEHDNVKYITLKDNRIAEFIGKINAL